MLGAIAMLISGRDGFDPPLRLLVAPTGRGFSIRVRWILANSNVG